MLVELHRKGGSVCGPARAGTLHCPLIVRSSSEDVVTGELVRVLRLVNPRHWVSDLLNAGLGCSRFRRQVYRQFRIDPWVTKPRYPRHLLPWEEGSTQVDVQITWENPPTTIYIEAKYGSDLSPAVSRDDGSSGFPSDQLIRNARVGLWDCNYLREDRLFPVSPREFAVLVLAPSSGHKLVERYRDPLRLRAAIPHAERFDFPPTPIVGEIDYAELRRVLMMRRRLMNPTERIAINALDDYLEFKATNRPRKPTGS